MALVLFFGLIFWLASGNDPALGLAISCWAYVVAPYKPQR